MKIIDLRQFFGERYPLRQGAIDKFIVHHTAGRHPTNVYDAENAIEEVDSFVRRERQWPGFPYHGAIWQEWFFRCSEWRRLGWHSAGHDIDPRNGIGDNNDRGIAVALLGDFTRELPGEDTLDTLVAVWRMAQAEIGTDLPLLGHQDVWATACPGEWWASTRGRLLAPLERAEPYPWEPNYASTWEAFVNAIGYLSGDVARIDDRLLRLAEANRVRLQFGMEPIEGEV